MGGNRLNCMDEGSANAIEIGDNGVVVDAALVAGNLGLSVDAFWRDLRRGLVYGIVERGEGEDAGRLRLTFNYRAQSWSVTVEETQR
jgi:Family of unknown function (DUF6522)